MKKTKAVIEAEKAVEAKKQEIAAAEEALKALRAQLRDAFAAVGTAMREADESLPRARIVSMSRRTGRMNNVGVCVIDRATTGGTLIVRRIGTNIELRFKWNGQCFIDRRTKTSWIYDTNELRDVPEEYLPAEARAVQQGEQK